MKNGITPLLGINGNYIFLSYTNYVFFDRNLPRSTVLDPAARNHLFALLDKWITLPECRTAYNLVVFVYERPSFGCQCLLISEINNTQ